MVARTSIQQDGHEEEINQTTRRLYMIASLFLFPLVEQLGNTGYIADFKVLPAPMRGNRMEPVWPEIALKADTQTPKMSLFEI